MIYETNYIMHYNKNHDKLGRFARTSSNLTNKSTHDKFVEKTISGKAFKKRIARGIGGAVLGGTAGAVLSGGNPVATTWGAYAGGLGSVAIGDLMTFVKMGVDDTYANMYKEGKKFTDDLLKDISDEVRRNDKR